MPHRFTLRVYYEDTDFSGVVYHANHLRYLERARTEMLREAGVDQVAMAATDAPSHFAVVRMEIAFRAPARMDDVLTVESEVTELAGASVLLAQRLSRDSTLLVAAVVKVALLAGGRPTRLPRPLLATLSPFMGPVVGMGPDALVNPPLTVRPA